MPDPIDTSMITKANAAFRQAAAKVVRLARQTGTPILVWDRDGIRALPPDEALVGAVDPPTTEEVPPPSQGPSGK
jgi:hypothetical protein